MNYVYFDSNIAEHFVEWICLLTEYFKLNFQLNVDWVTFVLDSMFDLIIKRYIIMFNGGGLPATWRFLRNISLSSEMLKSTAHKKLQYGVKVCGLSKFLDCILSGNLVSFHQNTIHLQEAFCAKRNPKASFIFWNLKLDASKTWQLMHPMQNWWLFKRLGINWNPSSTLSFPKTKTTWAACLANSHIYIVF